MAGRGTDIKLGEGVEELGGLAVIGTERHESRRIDDQITWSFWTSKVIKGIVASIYHYKMN